MRRSLWKVTFFLDLFLEVFFDVDFLAVVFFTIVVDLAFEDAASVILKVENPNISESAIKNDNIFPIFLFIVLYIFTINFYPFVRVA